jgi:hypothetical protein
LCNSLSLALFFSPIHQEEVLFDKVISVFIDNDGTVVVVSADDVSFSKQTRNEHILVLYDIFKKITIEIHF